MINSLRLIINYLVNRYCKGIKIQAPPVFIVGSAHSGTSLLLAVIGTHSRIHPVPFESKIGYKSLKKKLYFWRFNLLAIAHGKSRWIEKTPKHIHCIEHLLEIHPAAKILLIIRDGRDAATSFKARFGDLDKGINAWVTDNLAGKQYWDHPRVMVVRYENLINDIAQTARKVCAFIGEDFEPALLEYYKEPKYFYSDIIEKPSSVSGKDHDQYRNWQINQPVFDGRGKWRSLTENEKKLIKETANNLLVELGYITSADW
jgi:hypothetical protein